jgi:periplasmic protein CpxP/Spy
VPEPTNTYRRILMTQTHRFTHGTVVLTAALFCLAIIFGGALTLKAAETAAPAAKPAETSTGAWIAKFHDTLKITPEQEGQWSKLAAVMQENAVAMRAATEARKEKGTNMNAVDDLKSYSAVTDAQAEGMHKFIPAFEALYASMSDEQKKNADAIFTKHVQKKLKKKK